jgi:hypothetical protein
VSASGQRAGGRNYAAAFNSVTRAAVPLPAPVSRVVGSDAVAQFIDICDTALDLAFDEPGSAVLLPDVDVPTPEAVLKAYLLFLATEGIHPEAEAGPARFDAWYERVTPPVWRLLGFEDDPPAKLVLSMAFSLLGQREHQAPEVRALIWALGDLASCNLLRGVRS